MQRVLLTGLLKLELPAGDVRLCDGGTIPFGGETYLSRHVTFGAIDIIDAIEEGTGDSAPALAITLLPAESAAAADLSSGAMQGSRVRGWIAEADPDSGAVIGDPDLMLDMVVDVTRLTIGDVRDLEMLLVSHAERIFVRNKGNTLSGAFHKRIYASETGLDNAAGVPGPFAWGADAPARGTVAVGVGSVGGRNGNLDQVLNQK